MDSSEISGIAFHYFYVIIIGQKKESVMAHWHSEVKELDAWLSVDLQTRKIKFCYNLDSEGGVYRFSLLSECRDDVQEILKKELEDNNIEVMKVSDCLNFYTIVTNSKTLIFEW